MGRRKRRRMASGLLAAFLAAALVFGCGREEQTWPEEPPAAVENLRMIVLGKEPEEGMEELYEQLDALTVPELNCTVRFGFIPWGNERKQLNIAIASGEYDIIPGGNFSDYKIQISQNAFLNLNDYLYLVPELVEHYQYYSEDYLQNYEIDGGLYGIPQYGTGELQHDNEGFFYREDLRKAWDCQEITDIETMEAYLYAAKKDPQYRDEALITDNRIWQSLWILLAGDKYLEIGSMQETPFVVTAADDPGQVLNRLETPEFFQVLEYLKKWKEDGILEADMLSLSDNEGTRGLELMNSERKPCETNVPIWSVNGSYVRSLTEEHPRWEYGFFIYISANERHFRVDSSRSALYVSSRTKYPETSVKLLEKIHTDQRYYDLFLYGVDGIHYHKVGDDVSYEGISAGNKYGMTVAGDALLGRDEVSFNEQWTQVTKETDQWREETFGQAQANPLTGFELSVEGLNSQLEKMETVRQQYFQPLVCGYYSGQEDVSQVTKKLEEAGLSVYMQAIEEQLKGYLEKR
mgnify:CR=1 FL=1